MRPATVRRSGQHRYVPTAHRTLPAGPLWPHCPLWPHSRCTTRGFHATHFTHSILHSEQCTGPVHCAAPAPHPHGLSYRLLVPAVTAVVLHSTLYCTLYTVHCTLYTVHCALYTVHCTVQASVAVTTGLLCHHRAARPPPTNGRTRALTLPRPPPRPPPLPAAACRTWPATSPPSSWQSGGRCVLPPAVRREGGHSSLQESFPSCRRGEGGRGEEGRPPSTVEEPVQPPGSCRKAGRKAEERWRIDISGGGARRHAELKLPLC